MIEHFWLCFGSFFVLLPWMGRNIFTAIGFRRVEFVFFCSRSDKIDAQWRERRPCSVEKRVYYSPCTTHCMLSVPLYNLIPPYPFLSLSSIPFHIDVFNLSANIFQTGFFQPFKQWNSLTMIVFALQGDECGWRAHDEHEMGPQVHWIIFHWWRVARIHSTQQSSNTRRENVAVFPNYFSIYSLAPVSRRAEKYEKWLKNLFSVQLFARRSKMYKNGREASGKVEKVSNLDFSSLHDSIKIAEKWENRLTTEKILWKIYYKYFLHLSHRAQPEPVNLHKNRKIHCRFSQQLENVAA